MYSQGVLCRAVFSPDGRYFASGRRYSHTVLCDASPDTRPFEDFVLISQLLALRKLDAAGGFVSLTHDEARDAWQKLKQKYPDGIR